MDELTFTAVKFGRTLRIPNELLQDSAVELYVVTDDEWAERTEAAKEIRRMMDLNGATPGQKRSQTWRIKRMMRGNPRIEFRSR